MTDIDELVAWLRAQLDDDERLAREAADSDSGRWFVGDGWNVYRAEDLNPHGDEEHELVVYGNVSSQSEHIARHDPARVLREVVAARAILDEVTNWRHYVNGQDPYYSCLQATEENGYDEWAANPHGATDSPCTCGLEDRQTAVLRAFAAAYEEGR